MTWCYGKPHIECLSYKVNLILILFLWCYYYYLFRTLTFLFNFLLIWLFTILFWGLFPDRNNVVCFGLSSVGNMCPKHNRYLINLGWIKKKCPSSTKGCQGNLLDTHCIFHSPILKHLISYTWKPNSFANNITKVDSGYFTQHYSH